MLKNLLMNLLSLPAHVVRARRERRVLPALESAVSAFGEKKYAEVIAACTEAIAREPRSAQANHLCGRALIELDRHAEAAPFLKTAVDANPDIAEAQADLAAVLLKAGDPQGAEASCRRAVTLQPGEIRHRLLLVEILEAADRREDALAELSVAQEYAPERFDVLLKLFTALDRLGMFKEALRIAERAVLENGENYETLCLLSFARYGMADMSGAVEACRKTLTFRSDRPQIHVTLGSALFALGKVDEAMASYRRALKLSPDYPDAQFHIGLINLMRGKYREGWQGFEQRFRLDKNKDMRRCVPRWNGTSLRGRTLHVLREQGLGDEIMYSSCFPQIISDARHCHIECEPRLERLFARSFPQATFYPVGDDRVKQQEVSAMNVDVRSYTASLPHYLRNSVRDFPDHQGYLKADPERVAYWRQQLAALGDGLKIGISWRGGTVFTVPGVRWVNLQYGTRATEIADFERAHGVPIVDWPAAIDGDYDETAALVSALDLVISVCTSVVHLTGALGRPVWVMAAYIPEWRYGLSGETMPWYPTAHLFRQAELGAWDSVINNVRQALIQSISTTNK
jgi:tetratricopeptide (TPR) repeat protein